MKKVYFKKVVSIFSLFALLSTSINVYAVTNLQPVGSLQTVNTTNLSKVSTVNNIYTPKVILDKNVGNFAITTTPILNKEVLELKPITASNAGKVLNTWTVDNNFNKNFIVKPAGSNFNALVLKLNKKGLTEALEKTNNLKRVYSQYKSKGLGTLEIQTPQLERLPDRLVLTSKSIIKFKTKQEFENIKKYYKFNKKDVYQALSNKINLKNKNFVAPKTDFKLETFYEEFYYKCMKDVECKSKLLAKLPKGTYVGKTMPYSSSYNDAIEDLFFNSPEESEIISEEKIEISLLPVDPLSENNFNKNLKLDPKAVRIPLTKINNVFDNLELVVKINTDIIDAIRQEQAQKKELEKICNSYSGDEKAVCEKLADEYLNPKEKKYEKILINGFTLGNEYSYKFSEKWHKLGVDIYNVDVTTTFGYGFGLRIPIKAKITIDKSVIRKDDENKKVNVSIQVQTIDANAEQYRQAGIHESQLFQGKEFVFKIYAEVEGKLILVDHTVFNKSYDLIALLGQLLGIQGLHSFDKSKDFIPPYAGNNTISLMNLEYGIPIYSKNYGAGGGTLYGDLLLQAYIDGYIKAFCKTFNTQSNKCNKDLVFRSLDPVNLELEVIKNENSLKENQLGKYNNFGIVLKDFRYIPQLVTAIKTRGRLTYWYDIGIYSDSGVVDTKRYEIYSFTLDLAEIGAHVGYGAGGRYDLNVDQKQIEATDQKYYSKLNIVLDKTNFGNGKIDLPNYNDGHTIPNNGVDGIIGNNNGKTNTGKNIGDGSGENSWDFGNIGNSGSRSEENNGNNEQENNGTEVHSFIECARAGYEVSTGMPPNTCTDPEGNVFIEDLRGEEDGNSLGYNEEEMDNDFGNVSEDDLEEFLGNTSNGEDDEGSNNSGRTQNKAEEKINKYLEAANNLASAGIINNHKGDPINYNFTNTILRSEAAKIAVNLDPSVSPKSRCDNEFADVTATKPNNWTCFYVEALRDAGKLSKNKKFNPLSQLTKAEATKMMLEAAGCKNVYTHPEYWQAEVAAFAASNGLIPMFTDYNTKASRAFVFAIADGARQFCSK